MIGKVKSIYNNEYIDKTQNFQLGDWFFGKTNKYGPITNNPITTADERLVLMIPESLKIPTGFDIKDTTSTTNWTLQLNETETNCEHFTLNLLDDVFLLVNTAKAVN